MKMDIDISKTLDVINLAFSENEVKGKKVIDELSDSILSKSKDYCPESSGELVNSAYKAINDNSNEVGYDKEYALWVHELPKTHNKGVRKFLDKALQEAFDNEFKSIVKKEFN